MEGKSPEFISTDNTEKIDHGFSEKRAARIIEGKQKDNSQMRKTRAARKIKLPVFRKKQVIKQPISRRDKI